MSQMVATPQNAILANSRKWLNDIIFKNETMLTYFRIWGDGGLLANVAGQCIAFSLCLLHEPSSQPVQLSVDNSDKN